MEVKELIKAVIDCSVEVNVCYPIGINRKFRTKPYF